MFRIRRTSPRGTNIIKIDMIFVTAGQSPKGKSCLLHTSILSTRKKRKVLPHDHEVSEPELLWLFHLAIS